MQKIERLAIKYLIIGFGIGLIHFVINASFTSVLLHFYPDSQGANIVETVFKYSHYLTNLIVGIFILIDSNKFIKNRIYVPLLGFCLPVFGICFLLIENFLLQKTTKNE